MGLREGWAAARVALASLWRVRGLGALVVLLAAVAILRRGPEPEAAVTVVVHNVPAATATHGMPGVGPTIAERVLWRTVKADTVWITAPGPSELLAGFCRPLVVSGQVPDTSALGPVALLLTAGTLEGHELELYGLRSDGALWRQGTALRENHGGLRWRADGDSVVVRERRVLRLLGLRPTVGVGGGLLVGMNGSASLGGFVGLVLVR